MWKAFSVRTSRPLEGLDTLPGKKILLDTLKEGDFCEKILGTAKRLTAFSVSPRKEVSQSLLRAVPLVINEQPKLCEGSDCPDTGTTEP